MSQLPDPINNLSSEARRIYEQIVDSRGHDYPGLFRSLMLCPELAERFAELGTILRLDGVLRADIRELAILTVARELRVAYIWETHQENAAKAGLPSTAIADLLCGRELSAHDVLYPPVQRLVQHFLQLEAIPQDLQDHLVATLGLAAFVQLAVIVGYYRMIAGLATGFEFPLPKAMSNPFLDLPSF
jgi:alkylhydroperoxidase family enzyme